MSSNATALLERWKGFLDKVQGRLGELLVEADRGLKDLMTAHPDDAQPLGNALSGLDHRVGELRTRIQETWDRDVDPQFENAEAPALWDAALDWKQDQELVFDERWERWKVRAVADFYRNLWPLAQAAMQKRAHCTRCGGPLEPPCRTEVMSVPCSYCGAVNQVVPEKAVLAYFGGAAHAFAEEAALELRHAVTRFRVEVGRRLRRSDAVAVESLESLREWERRERAYWETYAAVRGRILGTPPDRELVESRMTMFRKFNLELNQVWRRG